MKKVVAIIQARLGSERLPNKVLLKIPKGSRFTCLGRVIDSVGAASLIDDITITTPNKQLRQIARHHGVSCYIYRGKRNVLKEYYKTATKCNAEIIVRITADCPLIDPEIIDQCIDEFLDADVDLVYNTDEDNGQLNGEGSDVEVFSYDALQRTCYEAKIPADREHVTKWMRRNLRTKKVPMKKLGIKSLNTWEDYEDICKIWIEKEK